MQGTWEHFSLIQQGCEQSPGARLTYFDGTIEILMPGQLHETFSQVITWLLTYYLAVKQVRFFPTGTMTQEKEGTVSAQADGSYCFENLKPIPDLAIEVVFTSGNVTKLTRYQALGVTEVWFWEDGVLGLYRLRDAGYERVDRSELPGLADLDLDLLNRCVLMAETDPSNALRTFATEVGSL
ncbi:Uma2 family endonuclease [Alkalinema pantanalense CENA528]